MTTTTQANHPPFSDAAVALWSLQNAATTARALAIMGDRVGTARYTARQRNAEEATATYKAALDAATPEDMDEYAALLRWRHERGMR